MFWVMPALQDERYARTGTYCVVEREPFSACTGFSFYDFADSHVVIPLGLVTPSRAHRLQGMTFLSMGFGWI